METKKIVEGLLGGVLFGFTAGIGFILATRIMTKKVVIESKAASSAPEGKSSDGADKEMNFSSFNQGEHHIADNFIVANKNSEKIKEKSFDFTTGTYF